VPIAPPIIKSGASTPPDVPELSAAIQITIFTTMMPATTPIASCPFNMPLIVP
jgi:hypothetical protein